jgi:hypothetical protein
LFLDRRFSASGDHRVLSGKKTGGFAQGNRKGFHLKRLEQLVCSTQVVGLRRADLNGGI